MKSFVRRGNRDKRVIETANFIPHNPHNQPRTSSSFKPPSISNLKECATIEESGQDETKAIEAILHLPLAQWIPSKAVSFDKPTPKVGSFSQLVPAPSCNESDADKRRAGTSAIELIPGKSTSTMSCDICLTPGSVIWAKLDRQMWWPAEVLIRELPLDSKNKFTEGLVLVDYFGIEKSGWVNATRDLSPFEECFEERSCNPSKEFQDALKQALHKMKIFITSSEGNACYDLGTSANSHRTESDRFKKGSNKRKKTDLKINEVNVPQHQQRTLGA